MTTNELMPSMSCVIKLGPHEVSCARIRDGGDDVHAIWSKAHTWSEEEEMKTSPKAKLYARFSFCWPRCNRVHG